MIFRRMRTFGYALFFIAISLLAVFFLPFSLIIGRSFNLSEMIPFFFLFLFSSQANRRIQIRFSARVVNSVAVTVPAFTSVSCAMASPTVRIDPMRIQRNAKYKVSSSAHWANLMTGYHNLLFSNCEYNKPKFQWQTHASLKWNESHRKIVIIYDYRGRHIICQCIPSITILNVLHIYGILPADRPTDRLTDRHQYQMRVQSCEIGWAVAATTALTHYTCHCLSRFRLQKLIRYTIMTGRNEINRPAIDAWMRSRATAHRMALATHTLKMSQQLTTF